MSYGTLYLCATPIGNLQDITLRVLDTLKTVDLVACEDTRKTLQLLNHFSISKPVTSYYEHNKMTKGDVIIQQLKEGKNIALVSDAGMPGISDPGYDLVQQCLAEGITFTVLPGAVAAITGLVLSGLPTDRFAFEGFVPRQKKERQQFFLNLLHEERTMIFYESPHRLQDTLETMAEIFPDRTMAAARELTKKFETIMPTTLEEALASDTAMKPRCPVCSKPAVLEGAYVPQCADKYISLAKCRVHGNLLCRLRFRVTDDGKKLMNLSVAKAAPSNCAYVRTKRLQVAERVQRYQQLHGKAPDPEEALLNADRSSMPFED